MIPSAAPAAAVTTTPNCSTIPPRTPALLHSQAHRQGSHRRQRFTHLDLPVKHVHGLSRPRAAASFVTMDTTGELRACACTRCRFMQEARESYPR